MNKHQISRRAFLSNSLFFLSLPNAIISNVLTNTDKKLFSDKFSGFIISDIHFGWDNPKQPPSGMIKHNLMKVLQRFPNLDILIDTGDAYHNNSSINAIKEWIETISETASDVPLMYIPGNHEISHNTKGNSEKLACEMGSIPGRPYYSLTIKGIHLVSLPQMMGANYITEEALEWLELDLKVHSNLTTLIFSHNSLKGTTAPHNDPAYRSIANSERVVSLLREHPQVIAWCHGHNHTWEFVEKWQKIFVSNGRFGGFPPNELFGGDRFGGIYFEIDKNTISFRGWSCSDEKFLDEISSIYSKLRYYREITTSFNPDLPPSIAYGIGISRDGQRVPIYRHYFGKSTDAKVYFMGVDEKSLNENNVLTAYGERPSGSKMLPAMEVTGLRPRENDQWQWTNPGILLVPTSGSAGIISPRRGDAKYSYYPTAPGKKYIAYARVLAYSSDTKGILVWRVHKSDGTLLVETNDNEIQLSQGYNELQSKFHVPDFDTKSIYSDESSDIQLLISAECIFKNTGDGVQVELLQIQLDSSERYTKNPGIKIDDRLYRIETVLKGKEIVSVDIEIPRNKSRYVVASMAEGAGLLTYLIEEIGIEYQVRNSPSYLHDSKISFGENRLTIPNYSPYIILAPLIRDKREFSIIRAKRVNSLEEIKKSHNECILKIEGEGALPIEIDFFSKRKPITVSGVLNWNYESNLLHIRCSPKSMISILWA